MMGLGMGGAPFERSGCAMKVVEPAGHRGALVGGNCGLCRLEIEERGRRCLDDVVDLGGREEAALSDELGDAAGTRRRAATAKHRLAPRSAERRVGKVCVRKCRYRWSASH